MDLRRFPIDQIMGFGGRKLPRDMRFDSRWVRRSTKLPVNWDYQDQRRMFRDGHDSAYFGHHCRLCWCVDRPFHRRKKGYTGNAGANDE